jgi:hypothetical protein
MPRLTYAPGIQNGPSPYMVPELEMAVADNQDLGADLPDFA